MTVDAQDIEELSHRALNSDGELENVALRALCGWGELLPDWPDDWVAADRERIRQLRVHTLEAIGERLANHGKFVDAIQLALRAIEAEPFRDSARSLLIRTYLAEGNKWEARRHYEGYRVFLRQELGVEPSLEIVSLLQPVTPNLSRADRDDSS